MTIGRKIIHLDAVDSTNNYAANLTKRQQLDHGTVILADNQFAGRGQRSAEWSVKPGENLTFSFFLDNVKLSVDRQFILTQIVSLSLVDVLNKFSLSAKVKWPNDIYCEQKKIAGVLIENSLAGSQVKSSIVGIGLNVNQLHFEGFEATSMHALTGTRKIPREVLFSFIESFNRIWNQYFNNAQSLQNAYLTELYRFKETANYEDDNGEFIGIITDVLTTGKLLIQKEAGELVEYDLKEIKFI